MNARSHHLEVEIELQSPLQGRPGHYGCACANLDSLLPGLFCLFFFL